MQADILCGDHPNLQKQVQREKLAQAEQEWLFLFMDIPPLVKRLISCMVPFAK